MSKIPTAEEFLSSMEEEYFQGPVYGQSAYLHNEVIKGLISFAQLHVKAALEAAAEQAEWSSTANDIGFGGSAGYDFIDTDYAGDPSTGYKVFVNKDSILNAYPKNLIQ